MSRLTKFIRQNRALKHIPDIFRARRTISLFTKQEQEEDEKYQKFHKYPNKFTIVVFVGGWLASWALLESIKLDISLDYFLSTTAILGPKGFYEILPHIGLGTYDLTKMWEKGIIHEYLDRLKNIVESTDDDELSRYGTSATRVSCLQVFAQLTANATLCKKLITETDFIDVLKSELTNNLNKEDNANAKIELMYLAVILCNISQLKETHEFIKNDITPDLYFAVAGRQDSRVDAKLAEMFANIYLKMDKNEAYDSHQDILPVVIELSKSKNTKAKNIAMKCNQIELGRFYGKKEEETDGVESLKRYQREVTRYAIASKMAMFGVGAFAYAFVRSVFRGRAIVGGFREIPWRSVLHNSAKASLVLATYGALVSAEDHVTALDDCKNQDLETLKRRAWNIQAAYTVYDLMLPFVFVYLVYYYVPYILLPIAVTGFDISENVMVPDESKDTQEKIDKLLR